ncbi:MAG TPA: cytochrome c peroxidase [Anaerolineales bacterium]|nr:cytochrome c peroxidase [Anaerolineales bacterium]
MTKPFTIHIWTFLSLCLLGLSIMAMPPQRASAQVPSLDEKLQAVLRQAGFTGRIESTLEQRLGRRLDLQLADLGRMLWFDTLTGLNDDNACAGCHSPTAGFGDTQSIAIGIDSNQMVGSHRTGPRNMRRAPMVINSAFFPRLMWNSRFSALSGDPFDNRLGFQFPLPEGSSLSGKPHLLAAQAFIPPTERNEVAGFHFAGDNDAIRAEVVNRLNASSAYRKLFAKNFPAVKTGGSITYDMFARAIAEFEFTLTFANAPVDRFARGELGALTEAEKQGALLFFGAARCSVCHSVAGQSNEMFSDFQEHVIGVPQIAPSLTNAAFDGPGLNEDFGLEQVTGDPADRYKFRTSPLRNVAVQPTFMHNGAFTHLEDAIRYHLNIMDSAVHYSPASQNLPADLSGPMGPMDPVLARLDPALSTPIVLTESQFEQLVAFVRHGLLDPRATPERLRRLVPRTVPSGRPMLVFEFP